MQGRIWVESEPGQGSRFHFTARFGAAHPRPAAPHRQVVSLQDVPVLIVDDNATNRRFLDRVLTRWGMETVLAESAEGAVRALLEARDSGRPLKLVLTDCHMLGMDGFALAERIKQTPELAEATIMMLTSGGQRGEGARCRELGIAAYLTKPIRQSELRQAISTVLGMDPQSAEVPRPVTRHSVREQRQKLKILLAEDNPVNQKLAARLLEKRGHTVVVAVNGREALRALDNETFDLVLMDGQMPDMDGFAATAAIRERERGTGSHLPIIALTAHALKGDRERCLKAGMDGYLSKPFHAQELFEAVEGSYTDQAEPAGFAGSGSGRAAETQVDFRLALKRADGDVGLLRQMATLFIEDCPSILADISEAIARGDAKALMAAAHRLKGSVANFYEKAVFEAAQRLESMGRDGELDSAADALVNLKNVIEDFNLSLVALTSDTVDQRSSCELVL